MWKNPSGENSHLLVPVGRGTVNVTVARGEGVLDRGGDLARGTAPGAQP